MRTTLKTFLAAFLACFPAYAQDNTVSVQTARGVMEFTVKPDGITDTGKGFMVSAQDGTTGVVVYDPQKFSEALKYFEDSANYDPKGVAKINEDIFCEDRCTFLSGAVASAINGLNADMNWITTEATEPPVAVVVPYSSYNLTPEIKLYPEGNFQTVPIITGPEPPPDICKSDCPITSPNPPNKCLSDLNICKSGSPPDYCKCNMANG